MHGDHMHVISTWNIRHVAEALIDNVRRLQLDQLTHIHPVSATCTIDTDRE